MPLGDSIKDINCHSAKILIDYALKSGVSSEELFANIQKYETILKDPHEWVSAPVWNQLVINYKRCCGNHENAIFDTAYSLTKTQSSYFQMLFLRVAPLFIIEKKFPLIFQSVNRNLQVKINVKTNEVFVVFYPLVVSRQYHSICEYNKGSTLATLHLKGYTNAILDELECACTGGSKCHYRVSWKPQLPLIPRIKHFLNFNVRDHHAILSHMESAHNDLQEQHRKILLLNEELTAALKEKSLLADNLEKLNLTLEQRVSEQVADLKQANRQLIDTNSRLAESERMNDLLTGSLVHDIKNQIFSISAGITMAQESGELSANVQQQLALTATGCSNAINLTLNILDISRMGEKKLVANTVLMGQKEVETLVENYKMHSLFEEKQIKVIMGPFSQDFCISADPYLLDRIFQNLFGNAAMYTTEFGEVRVFSSTAHSIAIENSSDPIPLKFRQMVFEKYARTQEGNSKYSKGLGLYFCKTAMEAQNGSIDLSVTDSSNCFTLNFASPE